MAELVVALDVPDARRALDLVDRLGDESGFYKVGLELFTAEGPPIVRELRGRGKRVFLDLKLHDIPNTVAGAVKAAAHLGVDLLTVHTGGGPAMLSAAVAAAGDSGPRLLGVTLLTSLSAAEVEASWGRPLTSMPDEVIRLAELASECGLPGVVASPLEAEAIRRRLGKSLLIVTPGIRLAGGDSHDQARMSTPAGAVEAGADILVVGRAVTAASDPVEAYRSILAQAGGSPPHPPPTRDLQ